MADIVANVDLDAARERVKKIAARIKEGTDAAAIAVLSRYGIDETTAAQIVADIYSENQRVSREVHKEILGV